MADDVASGILLKVFFGLVTVFMTALGWMRMSFSSLCTRTSKLERQESRHDEQLSGIRASVDSMRQEHRDGLTKVFDRMESMSTHLTNRLDKFADRQ